MITVLLQLCPLLHNATIMVWGGCDQGLGEGCG